jgi:hypothetical protein
MFKEHINQTAYEGVEKIEKFSDIEFRKYCDDKLHSCEKHIFFIKKNIHKSKIKVLEVGSGSGKLLYSLEKNNIIESADGFELSKSRCIFSKKFGEYVDSKKVKIFNEDFVDSLLENKKYDLIIGIDVVVNLIAAVNEEYLEIFFTKLLSHLDENGMIVLESMILDREFEAIKKSENNVLYTWKRFLNSDPFKYGLDEMSKDSNSNLVWKKHFISRTSLEEPTFTNILKPLSKDDLVKISKKYNLNVHFFDKWMDNDDTIDQEFVAVFKYTNKQK